MGVFYFILFLGAVALAMYGSFSLFSRMPNATDDLRQIWKRMLFAAFIIIALFTAYYAKKNI